MKTIKNLLVLLFLIFLASCGVNKHTHSYDGIYHSSEIEHWYECDCGYKENPTSHNYDSGKITVEPTDIAEGLKVFECLECDYEKETSINKIEGDEVDQYPQLTNADVIYYDGSIYTYGGNGNGRINAIYRYTVSNDKLYKLDVKLEIESTSHRVILVGSKVYIFGGLGNGGVRPTGIFVHDLESQTLEKLETEFPFGMNCFQVGYYGKTIYIIGGSGTIGNFADVYAFDLETYETTKLDAKLPTTVFKGAWCTVDKYAYVIGGTNGSRLTSIYRFDMETHEVVEMNAKLPDNVSQSRAVYDGLGNIYIYGGTIDETTQHYWGLVDYIVKYNIESDTAKFTSYKLPQVLANVCAVKTEEGIYILGGDNDYTDIIIKHVGDEVMYVRTPQSLIVEE